MQPSRIHHVGLPATDLDLSVAWYREALALTHEAAAVVPEGASAADCSSGGNRGQMEPSSCAIRTRAAQGTFLNTGPGEGSPTNQKTRVIGCGYWRSFGTFRLGGCVARQIPEMEG
ncbi:MAG: hypothetical protein K0S82_1528 [Gaiellaceae bacterium]|jgi:catechol 2,3-dioxygenase-like lactoylglutathione lyase family enzyme|nr:hypothetical protein [Gaiellaceae bacterium]